MPTPQQPPPSAAIEAHPHTVVGAAIIHDGRVLAVRRTNPAELAGQWEFPGGKVEPGEADASALVRECREELGIAVDVELVLGRTPISETLELVLYAATLTSGQPSAGTDHDALRWPTAVELDDLHWLDPDKRLLPAVKQHLAQPRPSYPAPRTEPLELARGTSGTRGQQR